MNFDHLPELKAVFAELRRGMHLAAEDGALYHALRQHERDYAQLFAALGFELVHHPHQFFYLRDEERDTAPDGMVQCALFMLILIDHLQDQGVDVEARLFDAPFDIDQLPHLRQPRYQGYLRQVRIADAAGLDNLLQQLKRYGFAELRGRELRLRAPAMRFVDLCLDARTQLSAATTAAIDMDTPAP
jgi:hypothetical protein